MGLKEAGVPDQYLFNREQRCGEETEVARSPSGVYRSVKVAPVVNTFSYRVGKRAMDVALAAAGLFLLSPLFAVICVLIKLTSRGPIFHRYEMVGMGGHVFWGQKFRSMVVNAHAMRSEIEQENEMNGPVFKLRNDPRVTRIGRWLRKYSIDEIPQLWSVLKGDMSIVGPRPPGPYEAEDFEDWHWEKLSVTPGMTSLWIVRGKPRNFDEWVRLDLEYIKNWSVWLDVVTICQTIPVVVLGRNY